MDFAKQLEQVQAQLGQLHKVQQMLASPVQPAVVAQAQQSPIATTETPQPTQGQELLMKLYDEFVNTDEGKQLAANLARFARFAQSRVAKQEA